ncbi:MAG: prenyltransferase, partial [Bacteroidota bacterium]
DLGIGAAALAAGAVAVHFKFRADSVDDRYRSETSPERGDEALLDEALRLDRYSAAALGAMQVGVGVLALRFVLR